MPTDTKDGHWVGASYEHSTVPFGERRWFHKDSMHSASEVWTFARVARTLKSCGASKDDFFSFSTVAS